MDEKNIKCFHIRWFDGKLKVKDIKERCKWKAYKVLYSGYNQGVDKGDQFLNMKKMYVLERNGLEGAWIIHGRHRVRRNGLSIVNNVNTTTKRSVTPEDSPLLEIR